MQSKTGLKWFFEQMPEIYQASFFCTFLRSSHGRCPIKKDVFKNFAKFIGKHLCWSLFLTELIWILQKKQLFWRTPSVAASVYLPESSCSQSIRFLFAKFTGKDLLWALFLVKLKAVEPQLYYKMNPSQVYFGILRSFSEHTVYRTLTSGNFCLPTGRMKFFHTRSLRFRKTWAIFLSLFLITSKRCIWWSTLHSFYLFSFA